MPEDNPLEPSDDLDDNLPDLLCEVERMRALGRALALLRFRRATSRIDVDSRMAAAESRRAVAVSVDLRSVANKRLLGVSYCLGLGSHV